MKFLIY